MAGATPWLQTRVIGKVTVYEFVATGASCLFAIGCRQVNRCMHRTLLAAAALITSAAVFAGPEGRFQAIPIDGGFEFGTEKALILDTVAGHMWIWVESPAVGDEPGGRYVIYQGAAKPR